jgi:hypothetical protein
VKALVAVLFLSSLCLAESEIQTDWWGGPGIPGPVWAWGSAFLSCIDADWQTPSGDLTILKGVQHSIPGSWKGASAVESGDFDGDGDTDIVCTTDTEIIWWENTDGTGTAWAGHVIDGAYTGASGLTADDLDQDGDLDVIASTTVQLVWWENLGGGDAWQMNLIQQGVNGIACIAVEDMDDNGTRDVLVAAMSSDLVAWWANANGQGTSWVQHYIDTGVYNATAVFVDDVDGDGDWDVLGTALGNDLVTWWENLDGQSLSWLEHPIDSGFSTPWAISSGDMDDDGDVDVAASSFNGSMFACWENLDGQGTAWTRYVIDYGLWGPYCAVTADPDEDGDLDVIGVAYYESVIRWWENTGGPGSQWPMHELDGSFDGAVDIALGDINGDGHEDCIGAAYFDTIEWWDTHAYMPQATLTSSILYTGDDPDWTSFAWAGVIPDGTSISFQVRASDDPDSMGPWSDTLAAPTPLEGILADGSSYFQYRAILQTTDPGTAPQLADAILSWNTLGVDAGDSPASFELLPVSPNPCAGAPSIEFGMPAAACVELYVFEVTGRLVQSTGPADYQPGWHTIRLDDLKPGIYFVRVAAGDQQAIQRFVVI